MNRRLFPWIASACAAWGLAGCDYSSSTLPPDAASQFEVSPIAGSGSSARSDIEGASKSSFGQGDADPSVMRPAILESVISLIQSAALKPGGENFKQAVSKLNTYFKDTPASEFVLKPEVRTYLGSQGLSEDVIQRLEQNTFALPETRHVEDCMLYYGIATRVAGNGEDLDRVNRVFDWMVRQVQLVPVNSLGTGQIPQAQARPYDVLLRGLATEQAGQGWSERGWLFMSLCRQLGIDVGLLTYTLPASAKEQPADAKSAEDKPAEEKSAEEKSAEDKPAVAPPTTWICAVLLDGKLYLFDPQLGLAVPGPDGTGVATLDQALEDPRVLGRLDLPGVATYHPTHDELKRSKLGILMDSSPGYLEPRMRLLQESLSGKYRTILYRDVLDQRNQFEKALGKVSDGVRLWPLPMLVETMLFTRPDFVTATQASLFLFRPEFPLLYARVKQLRGELPEAIEDYMKLRFPAVPLTVDKKNPKRIPDEIQNALDMYATYFLALDHLDRGSPELAERFFNLTLRLLPAPGPGQPFYHMFRWGAQTNLAFLNEARGDNVQAVAYYSESDPTMQHLGNLIRARAIVWRDPTAALPTPLPPAPKEGAGQPPPLIAAPPQQ